MRAFTVVIALWVLAGTTFAEDLPEIHSKAMVVLDAETGAEIHGKAADEIRPIASTTKIFVAMVVRKRNLSLDDWTQITRVDVAAARGGARTRLGVRESFRNRDLLRAMLISSDNRAPTALGRAVGLDPQALVAAMNKLAKELGLAKTRFVDPTGLRGNQSTAREMALALRVALDDKVLRDIMGTPEATIISKDRSLRVDYHTTNVPLAASKYRITGGKTGFTTPAGYCYITGAELAGRKVVLAFFGAPGKMSRFEDFNRVAAWLERGAPGARLAGSTDSAGQRPKREPASEDAPPRRRERARVAHP
ncbi:MAG TPA: serine hydrolase [Kofleriaceae bacterium]|nr:serine hydrolase [Kofleriaceae bacterium]